MFHAIRIHGFGHAHLIAGLSFNARFHHHPDQLDMAIAEQKWIFIDH